MKIAMAQINSITGDLEGNARLLLHAIEKARKAGCHLLVTPETVLTGYMSCDLLEVDTYVRTNRKLLFERIVPEVRGLTAVVGFVDYEEDGTCIRRRYNAAVAIQNGKVIGITYKQNLCRYRYYDETRYFTPGSETLVQELTLAGQQLRVGVLICEDIWDESYEAKPYRDAADAGANLVVVLNSSPFETGKWKRRVQIIRGHQEYKTLPLVYVNNIGIGDDLKNVILFDGRSMFFDALGRMVECGPLFDERLCLVEVDDNLEGTQWTQPSFSEEEELDSALTFALGEYCRLAGFKQVVLGVSGGVDSSLTATLAAQALGSQNVLGISLPSGVSSRETREDAREVCANLGVEYAELSIGNLYDYVIEAFSQWKNVERGVTRENFQARLRGLLLMGISNDTDRMVIATGNKTELGLGYCTLYGDMVGGLLLIGDVNKMQVYRLCEYLNDQAGRELIPESVFRRSPTAELAENQTDPFDYTLVAPMIDDLIARLDPETLRQRFRRRELKEHYPEDLYERYDEESFREVLADVYDRYRKAAFKRAQGSPLVIVSSRALGFDLRETLINKWKLEQNRAL